MDMKYSSTLLDSSIYIEVAKNYYVVRNEWFAKGRNDDNRHIELCHCISSRRKNLMFTGASACAIRGIPRLDEYEMRPHVISEKVKGSDIVCWRRGRRDPKASTSNGLLVASPVRAVCDLAKYDSPESLLVSINHCLNKRLFTRNQLLNEIKRRSGMRWQNVIKRVLKYASEKCDSPLETIAWLAIHRAGFIIPQQQVKIYEKERKHALIGRVDMCWEIKGRKIVLELDGKIKYQENRFSNSYTGSNSNSNYSSNTGYNANIHPGSKASTNADSYYSNNTRNNSNIHTGSNTNSNTDNDTNHYNDSTINTGSINSKYTPTNSLFEEKKREDKLRNDGYEVIRLLWKDIKSGKLIKVLEKAKIPKRRYRKRIILLSKIHQSELAKKIRE